MAWGISDIIRWGLARFTPAQRTAGGTAVAALNGGVLLDAAGATVATATSSLLTTPGSLKVGTASTIGTPSAPALTFGSTANTGFYRDGDIGTNLLGFVCAGTPSLRLGQAEVNLVSNAFIAWGNAVNSFSGWSPNLVLRSGGAGILEQRNGPAAQTQRLERTYTSDLVRAYTDITQVGGSFTLNNVNIGGAAAPTNLLDVQSNGTQRLAIRPDGSAWMTGRFEFGGTNGNPNGIVGPSGLVMQTAGAISSTPGSAFAAPDIGFSRDSAGVWQVHNGTAGQFRDIRLRNLIATQYLEGAEMTAPAAPAANGFRIFAEDNGSGKTRLMCVFASGAAQQLAIEP